MSIDQALTRVGATVTVARDAEALRGADALDRAGRRCRRAGDGPARCARPVGPDPGLAGRRPAVPRDLSRAPAPVRGQRRGRRADARRRARPDRPARSTRRPCRTSAGTRSSARRPHPLFDGIDDGADFYFVHSYAGDPGPDAGELVLATTDHGAPFVSAIARDAARRRPVPPGTERRRRAAPAGQLRRPRPGRLMLRRRVIPCLDVADGRVVKGTRFVDLVDEGDPPELAERYAAEGADELVFLDITAAPERRSHAPRHRRADGPPRVHPADRRRRRADRRRDARRAAGRRGQGLAQHRGGRRPDAHQPLRGTVRAPGGRRRDRRAGGRARRPARGSTTVARRRHRNQVPVLGGRRQGRPRGDRARRRRLGRARGRARRRRAARHLDRPRRHRVGLRHRPAAGDHVAGSASRSSRRAAPPARTISSRAVRDGGADAVLAASIFHRRIHSIADVKAAMAAAGLPVRLAPEAVA